jgi:hypothetical protein
MANYGRDLQVKIAKIFLNKHDFKQLGSVMLCEQDMEIRLK